jgi:hypothetical protein
MVFKIKTLSLLSLVDLRDESATCGYENHPTYLGTGMLGLNVLNFSLGHGLLKAYRKEKLFLEHQH